MGALAFTASKYKQQKGYFATMPGVTHVPYPNDFRPLLAGADQGQAVLSYIEDVLFQSNVPAGEVAAILVEPIQGEGGYIVPPAAFLEGLRELTAEHGMLLVVDEVQSGMGRTGKMFASEHFGLRADIVNIAKGIASGLPLGVTCARADVMSWPPGAHASTFGGNPVSCAAANATIALLKGGLIDNAAKVGEHLIAGLRALQDKHPLIGDVRGKGLMIGIEFDTAEHAEEVQWAAFQKGLLVLECGKTSVRMSPPLTVSEAEMATGIRVFGEAVAQVAGDHGEILEAATAAHAIHSVEAAG
jgi:4-aminobutyrate aminotransferase